MFCGMGSSWRSSWTWSWSDHKTCGEVSVILFMNRSPYVRLQLVTRNPVHDQFMNWHHFVINNLKLDIPRDHVFMIRSWKRDLTNHVVHDPLGDFRPLEESEGRRGEKDGESWGGKKGRYARGDIIGKWGPTRKKKTLMVARCLMMYARRVDDSAVALSLIYKYSI